MLSSIFGRRHSRNSSQRRANRRLAPQALEDRKMMAGINYIESSDTLELVGSDGNDKAYITESTGNRIRVSFRGEVKYFDQDLSAQKIAAIKFSGNAGDDLFDNQTSKPSSAVGGSGRDVLKGGSARDDLYGGSGNDTLQGRAGNDFLYGGTGDDSLDGGEDNDRLEGEAGNDTLTGYTGDDIYAFPGSLLGRDTIIGSPGVNTIDLRSRGGGNTLDLAETGWQTVKSNHLYLKLDSASAIDHVYGSAYADTILGNALVNRLYGMGGDDTLSGRGGADLLNGGAGDDAFPELLTTEHGLSATRGAGASATWEQTRVDARAGYEVLSVEWTETSAVRGDSWLSAVEKSHATVVFWLDPDWDGSARVSGVLKLVQAPAGDRIVQ